MRAAFAVMRRNGFLGASVQDILDEAGLSTRAFYRQFRSKDDLLLAMFRSDTDAVAATLAARVADAPSAPDALDAWVDEMLSLCFDARRARRVVTFRSAARQAAGYDAEEVRLRRALTAPLVETLERGAADGSFPTTDPVPDADAIFGLVWNLAGPAVRQSASMDRARAKANLLRFCRPALGMTPA